MTLQVLIRAGCTAQRTTDAFARVNYCFLPRSREEPEGYGTEFAVRPGFNDDDDDEDAEDEDDLVTIDRVFDDFDDDDGDSDNDSW